MNRTKLATYFNNFWLFLAFSTIALLSVSCSQADNRAAKEPTVLMGATFTGNGFLPIPTEEGSAK
ncbi:MAG: hypothetical protein KDD39_14410 [Bdellovibrionales bacterium]|nr:hypothetical protein [Bdellovibrionales bacterium]